MATSGSLVIIESGFRKVPLKVMLDGEVLYDGLEPGFCAALKKAVEVLRGHSSSTQTFD